MHILWLYFINHLYLTQLYIIQTFSQHCQCFGLCSPLRLFCNLLHTVTLYMFLTQLQYFSFIRYSFHKVSSVDIEHLYGTFNMCHPNYFTVMLVPHIIYILKSVVNSSAVPYNLKLFFLNLSFSLLCWFPAHHMLCTSLCWLLIFLCSLWVDSLLYMHLDFDCWLLHSQVLSAHFGCATVSQEMVYSI